MLPQHHYKERRQRLMDKLLPNSIFFIPGASEIMRNGMDNLYPFRQNSDLLYLTGFLESEAVLVLAPGRPEGEFILFNRPKNPSEEVWTGIRAGQVGACEEYGADQSFDIDTFSSHLPDLLMGRENVYHPIGRNMTFGQEMLAAFNAIRNRIRKGTTAPKQFINAELPLHELRLVKSDEELELMRFANKVSSDAHIMMMQACKPGMYEYEIEAIIKGHCAKHNMRDMAYTPIVGAGKNGCILHYIENNAQLKDGELLLIDAGGEYNGYSSDITRTFPTNGKFTGEQRALYEVVLATQKAVMNTIKPGLPWHDMQKTAVHTLTEGMVELGILKGDVETLIAEQAYKPYYMHLIGHWIGLDTHDVGNYRIEGESATLAPNMVTTVEPGLYIAQGSDCDERWWNLGIRIEDDVIVTESGHESMTTAPKEIDEIEALMAR
jgi:Xaa-Pro aminopeptidase